MSQATTLTCCIPRGWPLLQSGRRAGGGVGAIFEGGVAVPDPNSALVFVFTESCYRQLKPLGKGARFVVPQGHQWSGCSVRIELRPRLPHGFHCPLSAMRASCAVRSTDVCSGPFLPGWLGLRASGLYRVMRASWSAVTPLPGCTTAGPTWPPSLDFGVVRTMKNAVGTGFAPVVLQIQLTGGGTWGGGGACLVMCKVYFGNRPAVSIAIGCCSWGHTP